MCERCKSNGFEHQIFWGSWKKVGTSESSLLCESCYEEWIKLFREFFHATRVKLTDEVRVIIIKLFQDFLEMKTKERVEFT
jgi:hypothetical protein